MARLRLAQLDLVAAALVSALVGACSASEAGAECRVGSDCASGACQDGRCVSSSGGAAGVGAGGAAGIGGQAGAGGASGAGTGGAGTGGVSGSGGASCLPNDDFVIERAEVPLAPGLNAKFLVGVNAPVDTHGLDQTDGSRLWDLGGALPGDHLVLVALEPLGGKWFAGQFGGASYAARLSEAEELLGVFEITSQALLLRGVVSPTDGPLRTELTYDPPVVVLAFPLAEGQGWQTTASVTGVAQGVPVSYTEEYDSSIDARGSLGTPYAAFSVLRLRITLLRTVGLLKTTIRSFLFATECFGTVASIVAQDDEPNLEFTSAVEVRRLSP